MEARFGRRSTGVFPNIGEKGDISGDILQESVRMTFDGRPSRIDVCEFAEFVRKLLGTKANREVVRHGEGIDASVRPACSITCSTSPMASRYMCVANG